MQKAVATMNISFPPCFIQVSLFSVQSVYSTYKYKKDLQLRQRIPQNFQDQGPVTCPPSPLSACLAA